MKHLFTIIVLGLAVGIAGATPVRAQGTSFTYQGRLSEQSSPVTGSYNLKFSVFDAAANGQQIGPTLTNASVQVSDGLFIVALDFGTGVFDGSERWLEIGVRTSGSEADHDLLVPRQRILSAPYAIHAATARALIGNPALAGTVTFNPTSGPPFLVSSSLRVEHLNSDLLDGLDSTAFALTNHEHAAGSIASGVLSDARLSSNVVLLGAHQIFTGSNVFSGAGILTNLGNIFIGDGAGLLNLNPAAFTPGLAAIDIAGSASHATNSDIARVALSVAPNAVTTDTLVDGSVTTTKLATGAVTSNVLAAAAVTLSKIDANGAIAGQALVFDGTNVLWQTAGGIQDLVAGEGLIGGGTSGSVTLRVLFGGSGLANTAARSDHDHAGTYAPLAHQHSGEAITSGTLEDARLSSNVARLDAHQVFSGSNLFAGVTVLTNHANIIAGNFSGDGAGLTNLSAANLVGTLPDSQLSSNIPRLDSGATFSGLVFFAPSSNGAPFAVSSSNIVESLNSDLFDNLDSAAFWKTAGNTGTVAGVDFLGTTDEQPLEFKVNGARAFRLEPASGSPNVLGGYVGNFVSTGTRGVTIGGGGADEGTNAARQQLGRPHFATISGGAANEIIASKYATIGGGEGNSVETGAYPGNWDFETIGGGSENHIEESPGTTIAGGVENRVEYFSYNASIGGGEGNHMVAGFWSTIGGGSENYISHKFGTVGGGSFNKVMGGMFADFEYSTIGGGFDNSINNASYGTIAGGSENRINQGSYYASIGGGQSNSISRSDYATVGGGFGNSAAGEFATVPGGQANVATNFSLAAGRNAKALHTGSFVWGDSTEADVVSTANDQFTIRAAGGMRFLSDTNGSSGVELAPGAGAWSSLSDRNAKRDFVPVAPRQILEKLAAIPIQQWSYKAQGPSVRHIGPVAQDFHAAFGVGEDERRIATVDADGVALAAIQGLNEIVAEQQAELNAKTGRIQELETRLAALEQLVSKVVANRPAAQH